MDERNSVSHETADEERVEAQRDHVADRPPTSEESEAAERSREKFGDDADVVADHASDMSEIGAKVKGEGVID